MPRSNDPLSVSTTRSRDSAIINDFQEDDDIDVDFDAQWSSEDKALLRQIEEENRQDDELANDDRNRSALLASPLLIAAAAAAVTTISKPHYFPTTPVVPTDTPAVVPSKRTYSSGKEERVEEESFSDSFNDSLLDMDADPNEDDLNFGPKRYSLHDTTDVDVDSEGSEGDDRFGDEPNGDELHFGSNRYSLDDMDAETNEGDLRFGARHQEDSQNEYATNYSPNFFADNTNRTKRQQLYVFIAWIVVAICVSTFVGVIVSRSKKTVSPTYAPAVPTIPAPVAPSPTLSIVPTQFPSPTSDLRTQSPSQSLPPSRLEASPRPSRPTPRPSLQRTPRPETVPSTQPTIPPFLSPIGTPTRSPIQSLSPSTRQQMPSRSPSMLEIVPTSAPTGQQPVEAPTKSPSTAPTRLTTDAPSFSPQEAARRSAITALIVNTSGVIVLLDPLSPQYMAYQWILNDDPQQLSLDDTPQLMQRYTLATLFYSTNANNTWFSCGPPDGSTSCPTPEQRFLGNSSACLWFGITCASEVITTVNCRKSSQYFLIISKIFPNLTNLPRREWTSRKTAQGTGGITSTKFNYLQ
jgi:hypothetical protein